VYKCKGGAFCVPQLYFFYENGEGERTVKFEIIFLNIVLQFCQRYCAYLPSIKKLKTSNDFLSFYFYIFDVIVIFLKICLNKYNERIINIIRLKKSINTVTDWWKR